MLPLVLNQDLYQFSPFALPVLLVGISLVGLGLFVLIRERSSRVGILFFLFAVSVSLYLIAMGITYSTRDVRVATFWIKIAHIGLLFIPSTAFFLTVTRLQVAHRHRFLTPVVFVLSFLLVLSSFRNDSLLKGVNYFFWGYYAQYGTLGFVTLLFVIIVMAYILHLYWQEYLLSKTERQKKRFRGIFIAFSIGTIAVVDVIPTFGIGFYPFGYIPMFIFFVIMAYIITHYHLTDISLESAACQILEMMQGAVIVVDTDDRIRVVNRVALEMLGCEKADLLNKDMASVIDLKTAVNSNGGAQENIYSLEMVWTGRNGQQHDVEVSSSPVTDVRDNASIGFVFVAHDITKRKQTEQRLEQLALYDALTGLPNRTLFYERMGQLLALAKRNRGIVAILYMDLDRFKAINDTLGHEVGDALLSRVSQRMKASFRSSDTIARMGGDEFIGLCGFITSSSDAAIVAEKIMQILSKPFFLKGNECTIGVSIGISLYPQDGEDVESLVSKADAAMYRVKEIGKGGYQYFNDTRPGSLAASDGSISTNII
jgi:diguanylate cyclase (GGDEF)-like protein/PAS domain S-box-containing protein